MALHIFVFQYTALWTLFWCYQLHLCAVWYYSTEGCNDGGEVILTWTLKFSMLKGAPPAPRTWKHLFSHIWLGTKYPPLPPNDPVSVQGVSLAWVNYPHPPLPVPLINKSWFIKMVLIESSIIGLEQGGNNFVSSAIPQIILPPPPIRISRFIPPPGSRDTRSKI